MLTTPYLVKTRAYFSFCTFHTLTYSSSSGKFVFNYLWCYSLLIVIFHLSKALLQRINFNTFHECQASLRESHETPFLFKVSMSKLLCLFIAGFKRTFHGPSNFFLIFYNYPSKWILIFDFKGTLMQIWKFANISVFT